MDTKAKPPIKQEKLETGFYLHFKGNYYEVLGTVVNSETLKTMVLYHPVESEVLWVRPYEMFTESVTPPGQTSPVPRFRYIGKKLPV